MSDRNKAFDLQQRLQENGISDQTLLDFLINNWITGADAVEAMQAAVSEFLEEEEKDEDEEEVDGSAWRESEDFFDESEDPKLEIADLIGRDFFHKDAEHIVYTIVGCEGEKVRIVWGGMDDVYYKVAEVLMYVQDETWILT